MLEYFEMGWVGLSTESVSGRAQLREVAKSWALLGATAGEQLDRPCNVWQESGKLPKNGGMPNFASLRPHLQQLQFPCVVVLCTFLSCIALGDSGSDVQQQQQHQYCSVILVPDLCSSTLSSVSLVHYFKQAKLNRH